MTAEAFITSQSDLKQEHEMSHCLFCDSSHCSISQTLNKCLHPGSSEPPYCMTLIADCLPTLTVWRLVSNAVSHCSHSSSFPVKIDVGTWSVMPAHLWTRASPDWIRVPVIIITKRRKSIWLWTSEAGLLRNNELLAVCESRCKKWRRSFKCKHKADSVVYMWSYVNSG